jgi:hypothetical protein
MASLYIGTSAFTAAGWEGSFYPPGLKSADYLSYYATNFVSAKRTPSCERLCRIAMLRHDQTNKEGMDEVAKAGFRAGA